MCHNRSTAAQPSLRTKLDSDVFRCDDVFCPNSCTYACVCTLTYQTCLVLIGTDRRTRAKQGGRAKRERRECGAWVGDGGIGGRSEAVRGRAESRGPDQLDAQGNEVPHRSMVDE